MTEILEKIIIEMHLKGLNAEKIYLQLLKQKDIPLEFIQLVIENYQRGYQKAQTLCDTFQLNQKIPTRYNDKEIVYFTHHDSYKIGKRVAIQPINEQYKDKTFEGIYIGGVDICEWIHENPAIYIPELNKVILGMESFWRIISPKEELKTITQDDINKSFASFLQNYYFS